MIEATDSRTPLPLPVDPAASGVPGDSRGRTGRGDRDRGLPGGLGPQVGPRGEDAVDPEREERLHAREVVDLSHLDPHALPVKGRDLGRVEAELLELSFVGTEDAGLRGLHRVELARP